MQRPDHRSGSTRRITPPRCCGAIRRGGARFSVTVPVDRKIRAAIAAIPEDAWTPITLPARHLGRRARTGWISDAEVAEVPYTAFASKKGQAITARLIVRRVRDLNTQAPRAGRAVPVWRYHAVFTDSPFELVQAEAQHRDHAIVEQVFADLSGGPLAHLPSGRFPANAAWLTCAAIGAQPAPRRRGAGVACLRQGPGATIRRDLIGVAARIARHGRGHLTLHLPEGWHREHEWMNLFDAACGPPAARPDQPRPGHRILTAARGHPDPDPRARNPDKPQKGQRQESHAREQRQDHSRPPGHTEQNIRIYAVDRG